MKQPRSTLQIHIPRTGGTSRREALANTGSSGAYSRGGYGRLTKFNPNLTHVTFGHRSIQSLLDREIITQDWLDNRLKFCFVRNPYDRLVSLFYHLRKISSTRHGFSFKQPKAFSKFIKRVCIESVHPVSIQNVCGFSQANPQLDWMNTGVDFIGKYEAIEAEWPCLCRQIGVDVPLLHLNRSRRPSTHYRRHYTIHTKRLVAKRFKAEIERFQYSF